MSEATQSIALCSLTGLPKLGIMLTVRIISHRATTTALIVINRHSVTRSCKCKFLLPHGLTKPKAHFVTSWFSYRLWICQYRPRIDLSPLLTAVVSKRNKWLTFPVVGPLTLISDAMAHARKHYSFSCKSASGVRLPRIGVVELISNLSSFIFR